MYLSFKIFEFTGIGRKNGIFLSLIFLDKS